MGEAFVDLFRCRAKLLVGHNRVRFDASFLDRRATAAPAGNALDKVTFCPEILHDYSIAFTSIVAIISAAIKLQR
jgi:hypothetical protein